MAPVFGRQGEVFVPDVALLLEGAERRLVGLDVAEQADLPQFLPHRFLPTVTQELRQERVGFANLPRHRIDDQDAVLGRLEQSAVLGLARPHRNFGPFPCPASFGLPDLPLDRSGQPAQVAFEQVVARPRPHHFDRPLLADNARDDDEGKVRIGLPAEREGLRRPETRKVKVRQDHVPRPLGQGGTHLVGRLDPLPVRPVRTAGQGQHGDLGVVGRVFDNQNSQRNGHGLSPLFDGDWLRTSQYIWSCCMASAKRVKSTGFRM